MLQMVLGAAKTYEVHIAIKPIGNRGYDCLWQGIAATGIGRSLPLS